MRPRPQALYAEGSPEIRALLHKASQGDLKAAQQVADVREWRASAAQGDIKAAQRLQDLRYGGRPVTARPLSEDPFVAQNSEYGALKMREGVTTKPREPSRFFSDHAGHSSGRYRDTEELTRTAEALADEEARRGQGDTVSTQELDFWRSKGFDHVPRTAGEVNANKTLSRSTKDYLLSLAEQDSAGNLKFNTASLPNYQTYTQSRLEDESEVAEQERVKRLLTNEDKQEIDNRVHALLNNPNAYRPIHEALLAATAGNVTSVAGLLRTIGDATGLKTPDELADFVRKRAYVAQAAVAEADRQSPMSAPQKAAAFATNLTHDLLKLAAGSELVGTAAMFGGEGYLRSRGEGRSVSRSATEGLKGVAVDRLFKATHALPLEAKAPTVAAGSYLLGKVSGESDEQAIQSAATNAAFASAPNVIEPAGRAVKFLSHPREAIQNQLESQLRANSQSPDPFAVVRQLRATAQEPASLPVETAPVEAPRPAVRPEPPTSPRVASMSDADLATRIEQLAQRPQKGMPAGRRAEKQAELDSLLTEASRRFARTAQRPVENEPLPSDVPTFKEFVEEMQPRGGIRFETLSPDEPLYKELEAEYDRQFSAQSSQAETDTPQGRNYP
jgi:hypothetical protein